MLTVSTLIYARQDAASGEEVYHRLGCWNCHGSVGEGGRYSRGTIAKTRLPLRRFVGYVRLPRWEMPPYAPEWASDADLATVYHWLNGIDEVRISQAVTFDFKSSREGKAQEEQLEIEATSLRSQTALKSDMPDLASLSYRVTLNANGNAPVEDQTLEYQPAGLEEWSKFTTDEHGEVLLGQDRRFIAIDAREKEKARARLRMAQPAARMVLVIEALDCTVPSKPVVVGVGTVTLKGQ